MKRKPSWFKLSDAADFGFFPTIISVVIIYIGIFIPGLNHVFYSLIPIITIFAGVYANVVNKRRRELSNFIWYPTYGLMVEKHGYAGDLSKIDEVVKKTTDKWEKLTGFKAWDAINSHTIWVWFKSGPISRIHGLPRVPVADSDVSLGYDIIVSYQFSDQPLEETDFPHELGHLIQGKCTGTWDEILHHVRARKFGLP